MIITKKKNILNQIILVLLTSLVILDSCGSNTPKTPKVPKSLVPPGWLELVK